MNSLPDSESVLEVGKANFETEVIRSQQPVLVVFWAPWSGACRAFASVLNEVKSAAAPSVKLVRINADHNPELSLWYGIQSLPTLVCFVEGAVRARIVGATSKKAILAELESATRNHGALPKLTFP